MRGRVDARNVLFIIPSIEDDKFFKFGNQYSSLPKLYMSNQFTVSPEKLLSLYDIVAKKTGLQFLSGGQVSRNATLKLNVKKIMDAKLQVFYGTTSATLV